MTRYTLGVRIDILFADCLELALRAKYGTREEKRVFLEQLSARFDSLKFFLQLLWEIGALEDKQYLVLFHPLEEIGKMIGGWKQLFKTVPPA